MTDVISRRLMRRLTNNVRELEHVACLAEGPIIGLQDDLKRAAKIMDVENPFAEELATMRALVSKFQAMTGAVHEKMTALANKENLEIPDNNVVNGPGGK